MVRKDSASLTCQFPTFVFNLPRSTDVDLYALSPSPLGPTEDCSDNRVSDDHVVNFVHHLPATPNYIKCVDVHPRGPEGGKCHGKQKIMFIFTERWLTNPSSR